MVLMAGMLPGVECARRRRIRQGGSSFGGAGAAEAPCGIRRPSFCLYTGGPDHALLGSSSGSKERSKETARAWTLVNSNVREAKQRLDQKLRSQRESVVKRHQSTGSARPPATKAQAATSSSSGAADGSSSQDGRRVLPDRQKDGLPEDESAALLRVLQREVLSKNGRRCRFSWSRLGRPPKAEAEAECAVCLEELRAGEVLVHLPCAHRFHWACAVPWVQAASRCPVCRAAVHLPAA